MKKIFTLIFVACYCIIFGQASLAQGIGINESGASPDPNAILDVASSSKGLLIPRLTTEQRDAIASPPVGLQVFNTTTNTIDVFRGQVWEGLTYTDNSSNVVKVQSLADLPAPQGDAIVLDPNNIYVFSGIVDISPNYLDLNGAALAGNFPEKDGIASDVSGAMVRSNDNHVYIEKMTFLPKSSVTSAFNLSDVTGEKVCNFLAGTNVVENAGQSLGVGTVSGFKFISISNNYWRCADGIKVAGTVGQFSASHSIVTGISAGSAIEFLPGLNIDAVDLSNNYFTYSGQVGVKVSGSISFNHARMTSNMFNGVGQPLSGLDTTTPGWEMKQNAGIPDSRVYGSVYMSDNTIATNLQQEVYSKIAGSTTSVKLERFIAPVHNRLQYVGKYDISGKVYVSIAGVSPTNGADVKVVLSKNGQAIPAPAAAIRGLSPNQSYHLSFVAEVDLVTGDYIEVFIMANQSNSYLITDMQLRITD